MTSGCHRSTCTHLMGNGGVSFHSAPGEDAYLHAGPVPYPFWLVVQPSGLYSLLVWADPESNRKLSETRQSVAVQRDGASRLAKKYPL